MANFNVWPISILGAGLAQISFFGQHWTFWRVPKDLYCCYTKRRVGGRASILLSVWHWIQRELFSDFTLLLVWQLQGFYKTCFWGTRLISSLIYNTAVRSGTVWPWRPVAINLLIGCPVDLQYAHLENWFCEKRNHIFRDFKVYCSICVRFEFLRVLWLARPPPVGYYTLQYMPDLGSWWSPENFEWSYFSAGQIEKKLSIFIPGPKRAKMRDSHVKCLSLGGSAFSAWIGSLLLTR